MAIVLAIDPGPTEGAWCLYAGQDKPIQWAKWPSERILSLLPVEGGVHVVIEMIACYGMAVGRSVFETCVWIGRYQERCSGGATLTPRMAAKMHLCHSAASKDANVRQALIDRFGGSKEAAIGRKATPGPLYGLAADGWAALALAVTHYDLLSTPQK